MSGIVVRLSRFFRLCVDYTDDSYNPSKSSKPEAVYSHPANNPSGHGLLLAVFE